MTMEFEEYKNLKWYRKGGKRQIAHGPNYFNQAKKEVVIELRSGTTRLAIFQVPSMTAICVTDDYRYMTASRDKRKRPRLAK